MTDTRLLEEREGGIFVANTKKRSKETQLTATQNIMMQVLLTMTALTEAKNRPNLRLPAHLQRL